MDRLTRKQAIRAKCLECSSGQYKEVRLCPIKKCPLYTYRLGHEEKVEESIVDDAPGEKTQGNHDSYGEEQEDNDEHQ